MELRKRICMYEKLSVQLADLLRRHDCVVVPTFGAFIAQYQPSELNLTTGNLMPPSKVLAFNPELRHNDALLINTLARLDESSYAEAQALVNQFVACWQEDISLQGIVSLRGIGRFVADIGGRLHFLPENNNYNNDVYGMPVLNVVPLVKKTYEVLEEPLIQLEKHKEDNHPYAPVRPFPTWRKSRFNWQELGAAALVVLTLATLGWAAFASFKGEKVVVEQKKSQAVLKPIEASVLPFPMPEKVVATASANTKPSEEVETAIPKKPTENLAKVVKIVALNPKTNRTPTAKNTNSNEPVEVFTIALGSFRSPVNVEMLTTKAKERGDVVSSKAGAKGLTTVTMTVQLRQSELPEKVQAIRNVYGANAMVLKK